VTRYFQSGRDRHPIGSIEIYPAGDRDCGWNGKINAILGALRGGYVKNIITDAATAQAVLAEDKKEVI
jgi:hypothetical protein